MPSPLYDLLSNASSLNDEEMEEAQKLLDEGNFDPNETHQIGPLDSPSLLECIAKEGNRGSMNLDRMLFFTKATKALLNRGADPKRTNAVGQTPDRLASDSMKRILMKARGASYDQEQTLNRLDQMCRTLLMEKKSTGDLAKLEESRPFDTQYLGCPLVVALAATAFTRGAWAKSYPSNPKKMLVQTACTIRVRQMERLLKWIPTNVREQDQEAATAVFLSAFKAAQQREFHGWEDEAKAIWNTAETRLFGHVDWERASRQAMDGRFGALTPNICQSVLFGNGECNTPQRTHLWMDAMAALSQSGFDERQWLEQDNYRHLIQDSLAIIKMAWQPLSVLAPPPQDEETRQRWLTTFSPARGTEVLVEIMATNSDTTQAEYFGAWQGFLAQWLQAHPEQATRVPDIAFHAVMDATDKLPMRSTMRPLVLDAGLPEPAPKTRPKPRF